MAVSTVHPLHGLSELRCCAGGLKWGGVVMKQFLSGLADVSTQWRTFAVSMLSTIAAGLVLMGLVTMLS